MPYDATSGLAAPTMDQAFGYDELGRLTSVSAQASTWSYAYDANGNRTAATLNGVARAYTVQAGSNRLDALTNPARTFGYDAAGNTTADQLLYTSATYNLAGRLATAALGTTTTTFAVDGLGRRVRKFSSTGSGSTILFVYGQGGELLGEYNSAGTPLREYVWLGATPVAVFTVTPPAAPSVSYIHADHLNTPRAVTTPAGQLRWTWYAEPFGTTAPNPNPAGLGTFTLPLRFPGQYFDLETGLNYNYFRDYDSTVGRYAQSDPIGLAGGINTYGYVENNPLSFTDPEGLIKLHGNWCGPDWTGGFTKSYDKFSDAERRAALPPVTKLDSCCQAHDIVYAVCRKAHPCDAAARQKCFEQADRDLSSCASRSGSGYGANLLLFGDPQKRIQDYMRDSSPAAEVNAKECSCTK